MVSVEVITPQLQTVKLIHRPTKIDECAPVRTRTNQIEWVPWGGFIRQDRARAQLQAKPVLIEVVGWTIRGDWGWERTDADEHLQGCLVRTFDPAGLLVYGVVMGNKPRLVRTPGRRRITGYPSVRRVLSPEMRHRFPHESEHRISEFDLAEDLSKE
jgi:hypothetical protein